MRERQRETETETEKERQTEKEGEREGEREMEDWRHTLTTSKRKFHKILNRVIRKF